MTKLFEVEVEQKFSVVDRLVYIVRADNIGEAIKLIEEGQGNLCHTEELERQDEELYIDTAIVTEIEEIEGETK
jgi:hypothetical protein